MALEMRWVDGFGLYAYDAALAGPEQLPLRVMSTVAIGGWFNVLFAFRSEVVRAAYVNLTPRNVVSTTMVDVPGMVLAMPDVDAGHRLVLTFHGVFGSTSGMSTFRLAVSENGGADIELTEAVVTITAGTRETIFWTAMHVVGTRGPLAVKLHARGDPGATSSMHRRTGPRFRTTARSTTSRAWRPGGPSSMRRTPKPFGRCGPSA